MAGSKSVSLVRLRARGESLPFRSVNRRGDPAYNPGMQRHHLLPRQLLSLRYFSRMFEQLDRRRIGFDDFRSNGLLLPANENTAMGLAMPLHRGPHRKYNAMVIARVGAIESEWSRLVGKDPERALEDALFRLALLQSALRRRLLDDRRRIILNRKDPVGAGFDFNELDAMADTLWKST